MIDKMRAHPSTDKDLGQTHTEAATTLALAWRKFKHHKLAIVSGVVLLMIYVVCLFAGFFAPYLSTESFDENYFPPQKLHFIDEEGKLRLKPYVYGTIKKRDTLKVLIYYEEDRTRKYQLELFVWRQKALAGPQKNMKRLCLFGVEEGGTLFLLGTDYRGRDLFSRIIYGGRVSLTISMFGVFLSVILGSIFGTISGYYGGAVDMIIQRIIEIIRSIPTLPLWLALAAILPREWPSTYVYWGIVTVLALIGWTGLAREVRGKALSVRERDFVMAARAGGGQHSHIMFKHIVPNLLSHIIVVTTLALPGMIIAESTMSFLGLGIKPPMASWGLLLKNAQNLHTIRLSPWIMIPGVMIVITVLCFNFLGDGLRDAADPYA